MSKKNVVISIVIGICLILITPYIPSLNIIINLLNDSIKFYWLLIPCIVSILFLTFYIFLAFKFNKLQKEISGKTKKCISINNLSPRSKQLLNNHINRTKTMSYGLNDDVIEELKNLNIIEPHDKINYKLNFWFFECLSKNPNLLEVE